MEAICGKHVNEEVKLKRRRESMTTCWFCGDEMIWGGDHSFEDHGLEGKGIVANLSCRNEDCNATALFYADMEATEASLEEAEDNTLPLAS